jgi:hypothetical protein
MAHHLPALNAELPRIDNDTRSHSNHGGWSMNSRLRILAALVVVVAQIAWTQIPRTISYQGILTDASGKAVPDANYTIAFKLYDVSTGGTALWTESQSLGVTGGMINALIGGSTLLNLPFDKPYWLGVTVGTGAELTPRLPLSSAAYGLRAADANAIFGFGVSPTPQANTLIPLDATGKFPASVVSGGASGNYIRRGSADTSRGSSAGPMLLVSNMEDGDGFNGRSVKGIGVAARSDSSDGVTGWTGAATHSGVYGSSTQGKGVVGQSTYNNGVVGWTGSESGSMCGVFGHSTNAIGVSGLSQNNHGVVGQTNVSSSGAYAGVYGSSVNGTGVRGYSENYVAVQAVSHAADYAAIAAGNEGGGPAIYAQGGSKGVACVFRGNVILQSLSTQATILELGEGLDYAERFDLSDNTGIIPGTVLVIDVDHPGKLKASTEAYDQKVAGIVAGAHGLGSGVRLGGSLYDKDVALAGRVYCNVDGSYGEVTPGALLTTSPTTGYAMVVRDYTKASGAILGKAMESLAGGQKGQILVLVTLQ